MNSNSVTNVSYQGHEFDLLAATGLDEDELANGLIKVRDLHDYARMIAWKMAKNGDLKGIDNARDAISLFNAIAMVLLDMAEAERLPGVSFERLIPLEFRPRK